MLDREKRKETPQDIYYNSCIHYVKDKQIGNELRKIYLIDKRFIINENALLDTLYDNECLVSDYQDDYYFIFEISDEYITPGFSNILFLKLISNEALLSIYDFIVTFQV